MTLPTPPDDPKALEETSASDAPSNKPAKRLVRGPRALRRSRARLNQPNQPDTIVSANEMPTSRGREEKPGQHRSRSSFNGGNRQRNEASPSPNFVTRDS